MANVPRWASRSMWGGSVYKTARCRGLRSYSSTPLKSALGTLYTACQRVMDNTDRLTKYEKELQLFPADTNPASLWWTMVQLHMPQKTEIELVEFLEGAKMAAKTQLKAVNSKEFAEFAAGLTSESAVADELSYYCTPRFFENLKEAAASTLKDRNMTLELQDINIESVVVADVRYAQLTQTEYEAQTAGLAVLPFLWAADATIEYMQINVKTRSLETTKMTLIGQEECLALQDNSRTWTFGSKVGSFEELEWRIVNTVGANNAAKQLSRTVYADQVDDGNDMSLEDEQKL
ncbi:hypothetical protein JG688_00010086 [Phytophthora aleatoria]|uniref:Uncharacterized protein n=1 Tax=Phytophthora aleatoria TaxID=2496075 RepID=A0A8J5J5F0_9STRA|nr:hypothetical protein JG688_00010086 [Phytophthora aleatoria]